MVGPDATTVLLTQVGRDEEPLRKPICRQVLFEQRKVFDEVGTRRDVRDGIIND